MQLVVGGGSVRRSARASAPSGDGALVVLHKSQLYKEQRLPSTIRGKTDRLMVKSLYVL